MRYVWGWWWLNHALFIFRITAKRISCYHFSGIHITGEGAVVGAGAGDGDLVVVAGDGLAGDVDAAAAHVTKDFLGDAIKVFDVPEIIEPYFSVGGIIFGDVTFVIVCLTRATFLHTFSTNKFAHINSGCSSACGRARGAPSSSSSARGSGSCSGGSCTTCRWRFFFFLAGRNE